MPCELDVASATEGFGWGLWQWQHGLCVPLGFWLQLWKGAEQHDSPIEKQLCAVHVARPYQCTPFISIVPGAIKTSLLLAGWIEDALQKPHSGTAQTLTLTKWHAYLQQHSTFAISPFREEMYAVLEPATYLTLGLSAHSPDMDIQPSPMKEGRGDHPTRYLVHRCLCSRETAPMDCRCSAGCLQYLMVGMLKWESSQWAENYKQYGW
ncbi:hypothetical protein mRhiFer1_008813 [Rhinolophus ferrumequinum]|uniref:Uncharacterized protein n=1 Tax=Rhinolophus ferrumequinum TaxID=59479 RepID=A0A7J8AEN2_RHIFE|nr:hypothetical protein mRhiFer1_008813 [Rhinolophus ferrumequinum]